MERTHMNAEMPVVLITAAGRGMGAAIARELHARKWRVALMSPSGNAETLAEELGGVGVKGTTDDEGSLQRLAKAAIDAYGRIDGVVTHTGHPPKGDLLEISDAQWSQGHEAMLLSVIRLARIVTPTMVARGKGAWVNISTFAAFEPDLKFPVSCTYRAALAAFTKLYADRYAANNIRMNALLPGYVDSLDHSQSTADKVPMKRIGTTTEIAKTVAFLLSDDAGYITGQNIRVDGGLTRHV